MYTSYPVDAQLWLYQNLDHHLDLLPEGIRLLYLLLWVEPSPLLHHRLG